MTTVSTGQFFIIDVNDGSSLYTAAIYQQSLTQPSTPSGGSYNYSSLTITAPASWSSTLPTATTTPTWVSYYTFSTSDKTATVTATTWTVPTIYSQKGDPGVSAKTLSVISDRQNITYDSSGSLNPSSQTTTFTALKQNTTATVTWTMTKADGTALTASTYLSATTGDSVTLSAANFNTARGTTQGVIVTGSITDGSTITDTISVVKSADGAAAIIGVLTNEATTLAADSAGTVSSYTPASGNFIVYSATTDVSASATFSVYSQTGCTVAITAAGAYSVSAMSSDTATAVFQAVYNSVTIRKTLSLSKSKAGTNAITIKVTSDRQTIVYDSSGTPTPTTQTTTFTALKQNTTATVFWTMTKLDGTALTASTYLSATYGDSVSMTEANFALARGTTQGVLVKASLTDGSVSVNDTTTIVKLAPGAGATGERGSKSFYATTTGTVWSDTEANAAVTSAGYTKVVGDEVTLYNNGATKWTMTKRWDGSSWVNIGTVIDGSLIVSGSITSSAIDTRSLTIKDASGTVLLGAGVNLDYSNVGGTTKPADNATVNNVTYSSTAPTSPVNGDIWVDTTTSPYVAKVRVSGAWQSASNYTTNTNQLTDGAGLGTTATWSGVSGANRPADNATKNTVYRQAIGPDFGMGINDIWYKTGVIPTELYIYNGTAWLLASTVGATSSQITDISTATSTANSAATTANSANTTANAASTAVANKLNKSAADILTGTITLNTGGMILAGTTTNGVYLSPSGLVGVSGGTATFSINGTTGAAIFKGDLTGSSGTFSGSLSVGTSPAVSGSSMSGSGGIINANGTFALGNSTRNLSFDGTTFTLNGDFVATGNIQAGAVSDNKISTMDSNKLINNTLIQSKSNYLVGPVTMTANTQKAVISLTKSCTSRVSGNTLICNASFSMDCGSTAVRYCSISISGTVLVWESSSNWYVPSSYTYTLYTSSANSNSRLLSGIAAIPFYYEANNNYAYSGTPIYGENGSIIPVIVGGDYSITVNVTSATAASASEINLIVWDIYK